MRAPTFPTLLALLALPTLALAQNTTANASYALTAVISTIPPSPVPSASSAYLTAAPTGTRTTIIYTVFPTLSAGANGTYNATNGTSTADEGPVLNPLPLLLLGPKLRLYTPLLLTSHILSITTLILILHFGVEPNLSLHPPDQMLRGLYLLACLVAGGVGAGLAALWREYAEWGCGAVAGFALACWIEALRSGGVVQGEWRWLLFVGLTVGAFVLTTVKVLKMACLVAGTAIVGASGVMLGIDCFTAVGLKEFYVANLGFTDLFPQLPDGPIPLLQPVVVELSLIAALFLISLAIQLRVVPMLKAAKERQAEQRAAAAREEEEEKARQGLEGDFLRAERDEWEARHGRSGAGTGGTGTSASSPALDDKKDGRPSSQFSLLPSFVPYTGNAATSPGEADARHSRSLSISKLQNGADYFDSAKAGDRRSSTLSALPTLNLGGLTEPTGSLGIPIATTTSTPSLPTPSPSPGPSYRDPDTEAAVADLKEKMALLDEIRTIRASIGKLKSETGSINLAREESRQTHASDASRARTLSGYTLDVPRGEARRSSSPTPAPGAGGAGPSSPTAGLGPEWDAYLKQRKLYVPPPFPQVPAPPRAERIRQSDHVQQAIEGRRRRESMLELGVVDAPAPAPTVAQTMGRGYSYYDAAGAGGLQVPGIGMGSRRASAYDMPVAAGPHVPEQRASPQLQQQQQRLPHRIISPPPPISENASPQSQQSAQFTVLPDRPARVVSPPPAMASPTIGPDTNVLSPRPQHPPHARILTTGQLEARHRAALSGMQRPVSQMLLATQAMASPQGHRSEASSSSGSGQGRSSEEQQRRRREGARDRERERHGKERRRSTNDIDRLAEGRSPPPPAAAGEHREHRRRGTGTGSGEVPFPTQNQKQGERERTKGRH
ncbi:hypothetical protein CALCODRAFT_125980 [Calocera cornea HHB12733]|uniref:TM7S3/TM198-like domain-containing protein n=1 Tax=Calocera cornea HHB12733 TaxID=1353952 RepID=A0A165CWP2_9BASI|nr:hypothetical protein CALCODRAFT_125980 [Calocera cornea HHB12733]